MMSYRQVDCPIGICAWFNVTLRFDLWFIFVPVQVVFWSSSSNKKGVNTDSIVVCYELSRGIVFLFKKSVCIALKQPSFPCSCT